MSEPQHRKSDPTSSSNNRGRGHNAARRGKNRSAKTAASNPKGTNPSPNTSKQSNKHQKRLQPSDKLSKSNPELKNEPQSKSSDIQSLPQQIAKGDSFENNTLQPHLKICSDSLADCTATRQSHSPQFVTKLEEFKQGPVRQMTPPQGQTCFTVGLSTQQLAQTSLFTQQVAHQQPSTQAYEANTKRQFAQGQMQNQNMLTVTVIPCGREDMSMCGPEELPYELTLPRNVNESSQGSHTLQSEYFKFNGQEVQQRKTHASATGHKLSEVFMSDDKIWQSVFKQHLQSESTPNFSVYRTPFDNEMENQHPDFFLHILYMKSSEKTLTRNYNAQELELLCHNRFYGPLVVALNQNKAPYQLISFTLADLQLIETMNRNFQNKSIKDDFVPKCLLQFSYLNKKLNDILAREERYIFFMFYYKTSWCPTKKDSHDSKSCIYAHHTRDFRRPPDLFKYAPEDCETLQNGVGWDYCERGIKCNKCHTTVERLYHPDKYKRIECDRSRCNKMDICAFYHNSREKSYANKLCKQHLKSRQGLKLPNINQLHEDIQKAYAEEQRKAYTLEQNQSQMLAQDVFDRPSYEVRQNHESNHSGSSQETSPLSQQINSFIFQATQHEFRAASTVEQSCGSLDPTLLQAQSFKPTSPSQRDETSYFSESTPGELHQRLTGSNDRPVVQQAAFQGEEFFGWARPASYSMQASMRPQNSLCNQIQYGIKYNPNQNSSLDKAHRQNLAQPINSNQRSFMRQGTLGESVPDMSFESQSHENQFQQNNQGSGVDGQTKSTASEFSRDKLLFDSNPSQFAKRHRQTEAANRSRFAEIFAATSMDKLSSDNGFCQKVFFMPLGETELVEEDKGIKLVKQESAEIRSPSPLKANLTQIQSLLDEDDECFCRDNITQLEMTRQKSKTEYQRRPADARKDSRVSAIQEVEPTAEDGSATNSQSIFQQPATFSDFNPSPLLKLSEQELNKRPSPAISISHQQVLQNALADQEALFDSFFANGDHMAASRKASGNTSQSFHRKQPRCSHDACHTTQQLPQQAKPVHRRLLFEGLKVQTTTFEPIEEQDSALQRHEEELN